MGCLLLLKIYNIYEEIASGTAEDQEKLGTCRLLFEAQYDRMREVS